VLLAMVVAVAAARAGDNNAVIDASCSNDIWPSVMKFEAEVIAMTSSLLGGGDPGVVGAMTSGGTESIIMSCKTHRQWAEITKGVKDPEIICSARVIVKRRSTSVDIPTNFPNLTATRNSVKTPPIDKLVFQFDLRRKSPDSQLIERILEWEMSHFDLCDESTLRPVL
jgi:hypothetical protein